MERKHSSFLLRCWWRNNGLERIEIEHVQSGKRRLVSSVNDAMSWISSQSRDPGGTGGEEDDTGRQSHRQRDVQVEQTKGTHHDT